MTNKKQGRQRSINATLRGVSLTTAAVEEHYVTYSECESVSLVIQQRKRMRLIVLSVSCAAVPYCSTLCHKQHDCRKKKVLDHKTRVLILSTTVI